MLRRLRTPLSERTTRGRSTSERDLRGTEFTRLPPGRVSRRHNCAADSASAPATPKSAAARSVSGPSRERPLRPHAPRGGHRTGMSPALAALVVLLLLAGAGVPPPSAFACRSDADCTTCRICESPCKRKFPCDPDFITCILPCLPKICITPNPSARFDCDDADVCTRDICDLQMQVCLHETIEGCEMCDPSNPSDKQCNDFNPCTNDRCGRDGICSNTPIPNCCTTQAECDDGNPCTADACVREPGSRAGVCSYDRKKHNGDPCGGSCMQLESATAFVGGTCQDGDCSPGIPLPCTDPKVCTMDTCDPEKGCQFPPIPCCPCETDADCGANACNGVTCQDHKCPCPPAAAMEISCDSGDECTKDGCDPATGCTHKPVTCDDGGPCTDSCRQGCQERHSPAFFEHVSCWAMKSVCEDIPAGSNDCLNRVVRTLMKTAPDANRKRKRHSARAALACARRLIGTRGMSDNCAMELQDLENRVNDWLAANVHKPASQRTGPPAVTKLKTVALPWQRPADERIQKHAGAEAR